MLSSNKFFSHPEGYVEPTNTGFDYVYQYKDHLGNVRLSYSDMNKDGIVAPANWTTVFSDDLENSAGWDSEGALYGWSAPIDTTKGHLDNSSVKLHRTVTGGYYAHSNKWIPINESEPTTYKFSGWVYVESSGYSWVRLSFFMNEDTETDYYTEVSSTSRVYTKNQWVYLEQEVTVPENIDKINLRVGLYNGSPSVTAWFDELRIERIGESEIVEENNYYPFGLKHKGYNNVTSANVNSVASKFKFNGVELEESLGLDLYEMDLRQYDPAIVRFTSIDPVTHFSMSTYTAFDNNPIFWADPSGADGEHYNWDTGIYEDDQGNEVSFQTALASVGLNSNGSEKSEGNTNENNNSSEDCCGSSSLGSSFGSWSENDREWFENNPEKADVIQSAATKAGAIEFFGAGTITNNDGYGDALRHSYWMYLITLELGADVAKRFGDMHENISLANGTNNNQTPRGVMDLNNNNWGINFAVKNKTNLTNFQYHFDSAVLNKEIIILRTNTIPNIIQKRERQANAIKKALNYGERE